MQQAQKRCIVLCPEGGGSPVRQSLAPEETWKAFVAGARQRLRDDFQPNAELRFFVDGGRIRIMSPDDLCDGEEVIVSICDDNNARNHNPKREPLCDSGHAFLSPFQIPEPITQEEEAGKEQETLPRWLQWQSERREPTVKEPNPRIIRRQKTERQGHSHYEVQADTSPFRYTSGELRMREYLSIGFSSRSCSSQESRTPRGKVRGGLQPSSAIPPFRGSSSQKMRRAWDSSTNPVIKRPNVFHRGPWQIGTSASALGPVHSNVNEDKRLIKNSCREVRPPSKSPSSSSGSLSHFGDNRSTSPHRGEPIPASIYTGGSGSRRNGRCGSPISNASMGPLSFPQDRQMIRDWRPSSAIGGMFGPPPLNGRYGTSANYRSALESDLSDKITGLQERYLAIPGTPSPNGCLRNEVGRGLRELKTIATSTGLQINNGANIEVQS